MKTLAYALAGCLVLLLAPAVAADCPGGICPEDVPDRVQRTAECSIFVYWLDPPGYRLDPSCIGSGG